MTALAGAGGGLERPRLDHRLDLGQPRVLADGPCAGQAELDPVVGGRVVRPGEGRARHVELPGREVQQVGRDQPQVDDVRALLECARDEGVAQVDARRAHVAPHDDGGGLREADERAADGPRQLRVELVGHEAAYVVCLEDDVDGGHCGTDDSWPLAHRLSRANPA